MILTWAERCEKFGNEIVTNAKIQQIMQEEIDELRQELALQRLSDIGQAIERELSDEEILQTWLNKNKLNGAQGILDFARAILAKACNLK